MENNKCKTFSLIVAMIASAALEVSAQDILTKRNGDELEVKVTEITDTQVKYKKWSNQDGPTYSVNKGDVFMVKYKNGEKDVFSEASTTTQNNEEQKPQSTIPAADNDELIAKYNSMQHKFVNVKVKDELSKHWWGTIGVSKASVLSSKDITIKLEQDKETDIYTSKEIQVSDEFFTKWPVFRGRFYILIENKTSSNLYIDKGNSFRLDKAGTYMPYYKGDEQTTISKGGSTGGSLNLGSVAGVLGVGGFVGGLANGINVGSAKSNTVSTTYTEQRFITIPPHGSAILSKDDFIKISKTRGKVTSLSESFQSLKSEQLNIKRGEYQEYSEKHSPASFHYIINYSFDPEFKRIQTQEFDIYLKDAIGINRTDVVNTESYKQLKAKRTQDVDECTIIVGDCFSDAINTI